LDGYDDAARRRRRQAQGSHAMEIDTDRVDEAVLALLHLGLHDRWRAWKSFDWDAMDRLHEKGLISDPVSKAKSVVLTEEGPREAERLFQELFSRPAAEPPATATQARAEQ
jgi:hypothetical protein